MRQLEAVLQIANQCPLHVVREITYCTMQCLHIAQCLQIAQCLHMHCTIHIAQCLRKAQFTLHNVCTLYIAQMKVCTLYIAHRKLFVFHSSPLHLLSQLRKPGDNTKVTHAAALFFPTNQPTKNSQLILENSV